MPLVFSERARKAMQIFEAAKAIWFFDHTGDPKAPHAELTGGLCSDGYANCRIVASDPRNLQRFGFWMIEEVLKRKLDPDWIVGSAYAAITISYEVARQLGVKHGF